jgi:hypothetical protein
LAKTYKVNILRNNTLIFVRPFMNKYHKLKLTALQCGSSTRNTSNYGH